MIEPGWIHNEGHVIVQDTAGRLELLLKTNNLETLADGGRRETRFVRLKGEIPFVRNRPRKLDHAEEVEKAIRRSRTTGAPPKKSDVSAWAVESIQLVGREKSVDNLTDFK